MKIASPPKVSVPGFFRAVATDDPTVLAWAAEENRILLTHDVATMSRYAYDRVEVGLPMPGVFEIPTSLPLAVGIEELSLDGEWEGQVRYLPLR